MLFIENGDKKLPTIILLHGGGLSYWTLTDIVELLKEDYRIITPIIDGHSDDGNNEFISIEDSAKKLIRYIEQQCEGKVFALGGLSIGAQIAAETLSRKENIAQYAILESALIIPIVGTRLITIPMIKHSYGLIKNKWFSKMQAKTSFIQDNMFERYYYDSLKLSKQSLVNMILSNGTYKLKQNIENIKTKVLVIVGEKEINILKKSAKILNKKISNSVMYLAKKMGHGELSLKYPKKYVEIIKEFFTNIKCAI
jgi:pimeloyl-ACP methyl ester carboxylesterase